MVKHERVTAVEHPDALPGITRDTLLTLSGADARMVTLAELHDADEIFACGTAAEVAPIAAIDRRILDDHPVSDELAAMYARAVPGEEAASPGWLPVACAHGVPRHRRCHRHCPPRPGRARHVSTEDRRRGNGLVTARSPWWST